MSPNWKFWNKAVRVTTFLPLSLPPQTAYAQMMLTVTVPQSLSSAAEDCEHFKKAFVGILSSSFPNPKDGGGGLNYFLTFWFDQVEAFVGILSSSSRENKWVSSKRWALGKKIVRWWCKWSRIAIIRIKNILKAEILVNPMKLAADEDKTGCHQLLCPPIDYSLLAYQTSM